MADDAIRFQIVVDGSDAIPAAMAEASASIESAFSQAGAVMQSIVE